MAEELEPLLVWFLKKLEIETGKKIFDIFDFYSVLVLEHLMQRVWLKVFRQVL